MSSRDLKPSAREHGNTSSGCAPGDGCKARPPSDSYRLPDTPGVLFRPAEGASVSVHDPYHRRSRGALPINRAVVDSLDLLVPRKNQLFIVHQTGEADYNAVRVAYAKREFKAEVLPFIENMAERFAQADLIVCRSGAITVAEILPQDAPPSLSPSEPPPTRIRCAMRRQCRTQGRPA